jgi:hypothetical protein
MNPSDLAWVLVLASMAWGAGIAIGGAGFWLAAAWLDRAPHRDDLARRTTERSRPGPAAPAA